MEPRAQRLISALRKPVAFHDLTKDNYKYGSRPSTGVVTF